ncbi:hypothetical protein C7B64_15745 [Merismopedia glauca CCAP 1448/3]|uniref:Uncharacterized protein n=1 Tax=Merismopedia glauca CCAP 1448/3 TaxID=1296344 RepID=A0A2T1C1B2_9CYAN|nr:hypothetical protein C7B64_15745 [Merismopedia glauca CCAP 1448/3]
MLRLIPGQPHEKDVIEWSKLLSEEVSNESGYRCEYPDLLCATLEDPRYLRGKEHLLLDSITISLCGLISGAELALDISVIN